MVSQRFKILTIIAGLCLPPGPAVATEPLRLLALGDSLTAGFGLKPGEGFTDQLQRELDARGVPVLILNAGVSGDTTSGGLARLEWALGDRPDMIILALGANDGLRAVNPEVTRSNLAAILEQLRLKKLPVLLAGIYAPPNLGREYAAEFNRIFPELAAEYDALLYPFFLDGVAARPELNQSDGMHPNAAGVAVMVERIAPYVIRLVGAALAAKSSDDSQLKPLQDAAELRH